MSFDEAVKNTLKEKTQDIYVGKHILGEIKEELNAERKVRQNMKINKRAFGICLAAVIAVVGATVAVASGGFKGTISHSSHSDDIKEFPSAETVEEKVGYLPKYTEDLQGHEFYRASISTTHEEDEVGNKANERKEIDFWYESDGILSLNTSPVYYEGNFDNEKKDEVIEYGEIKLYYDSFVYKCVPPDYVASEEEKALEESGELMIGYGSDKVEEKVTQSINWYENNISYDLMDLGAGIDKDEFVLMAKQVIDSK